MKAITSDEKAPHSPNCAQLVTEALARVMVGSAGFDPKAIVPDATLGGDLGLSSVAVARLVALLRQRLGGPPLPLHRLFIKPDGSVASDVRVSDLIAFLEAHSRQNAS